MSDRPTNAERAEAHDRLIVLLDQARQLGYRAGRVLNEPEDRNRPTNAKPLFPYRGNKIERQIDVATEALWEAHRIAASDAYDYHAAARADALTDAEADRLHAALKEEL